MYLNKYLERAVDIGFISKVEYFSAKKQLDAMNSI